MADEFLTLTQVAARLGLRERVIQHHVDAGSMPYRKIGKAIRFRWSEVEVWWQSLPGREIPASFPAPHKATPGISEGRPASPEPPEPLRRRAPGQHRAMLKLARNEK